MMAKVPQCGIKVATLLGVTRTIPKCMWNDCSPPCQTLAMTNCGCADEGNLKLPKIMPSQTATKDKTKYSCRALLILCFRRSAAGDAGVHVGLPVVVPCFVPTSVGERPHPAHVLIGQ